MPDSPGLKYAQLMIVGCPNCTQQTPMRHLHDAAHGITGSHMDGSERFECSTCGYTLSRDEAEGRALEYKLDVYTHAAQR